MNTASTLALVQDGTPAALDEAERQIWRLVLASFLEAKRGISGSQATYDSYQSVLARFYCDDFAKSPDAYSMQEALDFINQPSQGCQRRGLPVSAATRNKRLACLASWYSYCQQYTLPGADGRPRRLLPVDYVPPVHGIEYGRPARKHRQFSMAELEKLWSVIPTIDENGCPDVRGLRDRAIFSLFFFSLRRRHEIEMLTWGDFERVTFPDGREGWQYKYHVGKNGSQEKIRECPPVAMQSILTYLEVSGRMKTLTPSSPLFICIPPKTGGGTAWGKVIPLRGSSMLRILRNYVTASGLDPERICLHSFRHSGSRERYRLNRDPLKMQAALDHKSLATTFTYLEELTVAQDDEAALLASQVPFLSQR